MCRDSEGNRVQNVDGHHAIHYSPRKFPIQIEPEEGLIFFICFAHLQEFELFIVISSCAVHKPHFLPVF